MRVVPLLLPLLLVSGCSTLCGCSDEKDRSPTAPTVVVPPAPVVHEVEFRVTGTDPGVIEISLTSTQEGTTTLRTNLPWFASFRSTRSSQFLALQAKDVGFFVGTVTVQIFVDGQLFRESSVNGFAPTAEISGQWSAP
jgi:hypothetical protein